MNKKKIAHIIPQFPATFMLCFLWYLVVRAGRRLVNDKQRSTDVCKCLVLSVPFMNSRMSTETRKTTSRNDNFSFAIKCWV